MPSSCGREPRRTSRAAGVLGWGQPPFRVGGLPRAGSSRRSRRSGAPAGPPRRDPPPSPYAPPHDERRLPVAALPAAHRQFCMRLRDEGATVLGVADEPYDHLHHELRAALADYYRVDDMHRYDDLVRALGWLTHRHGRIDRIESLNEHWLETDARLRTDFNVPGIGIVRDRPDQAQVGHEAGLPAGRDRDRAGPRLPHRGRDAPVRRRGRLPGHRQAGRRRRRRAHLSPGGRRRPRRVPRRQAAGRLHRGGVSSRASCSPTTASPTATAGSSSTPR